jgi:hypothetical protein
MRSPRLALVTALTLGLVPACDTPGVGPLLSADDGVAPTPD